MKNNISVCAISEFVNEVKESPKEAMASYGVRLDWESGARSEVTALPMKVGPHTVSRNFSWRIDEPRQLLGSNHAANPQEYLLSGFGACMMIAFVAGATARDIQLETVSLEITAILDLQGFLGIVTPLPVGFSEIEYEFKVTGTASEEEFRNLLDHAERHSPNAQTLAKPVKLKKRLKVLERSSTERA